MIGLLMLQIALAAQPKILVEGSTGSDGALDTTRLAALRVGGTGDDYQLAVPPGGRFNFTTITIPAGVTLRFQRNAMNDPVYLLATGQVTIAGVVHVDGQRGQDAAGGAGGPGGYDGGSPGFGQTPGDGHGPGGGSYAVAPYPRGRAIMAASHATVANGSSFGYGAAVGSAPTYGAPTCFPLVGGSGGAGALNRGGGGGGGGALLIASEEQITVTGTVRADPGVYDTTTTSSGNGSGGCLRLVAPTVVVSGTLRAAGGNTTIDGADWGGFGRVRIDTINRAGLAGSSTPPYSVGANMVITAPTMPSIRVVSAAGTMAVEGAQLFVTITNQTAPSLQPVVVELQNFPTACTTVDVITVPASGAKATTTFTTVPNGSHSLSVNIPANTPTSIEVYAKAVACGG